MFRPPAQQRPRFKFTKTPFPVMKQILPLSILFVLAALSARAQTVSQSINLQAGWNSIWLEVTPNNTDLEAVFSGVPLEAVWTFQRRLSAVDYIQNVNEPLWNRDQWLVHVPTNRVESINNNLFAVFGQRAYLVKMTAAATMTVTGQPSGRGTPWAPDAYNLRGYPIDPASPPTFNNFFSPSPAHFNSVSNRLERIYKLTATGAWTLAGPGERMQRGVAYWTYCRGNSDYQAPLSLVIDGLEGLDFGGNADDLTLGLVNRGPTSATVSVRDLSSPTPLAYALVNPSTGLSWFDLPPTLSTNVGGGGAEARLRLAVRRSTLAGDYHSLLEVRNGAGVRWFLPLSAQRQPVVTPGSFQPAGAAGSARYAGLWAGNVTVDAVSQAHNPTNNTITTAAGGDFPLRLLLHVDDNGVTRLLREVIQLRQPPTSTNNAQGLQVQATPERFLLVTDERLVPGLTGSVLRDGELVGRRMSTAGFDFPTTPDANYIRLTGVFGGTNTASGNFVLAPTFARNPFLHRYHPDHDNLNATFNGFSEEAYSITRAFELAFSPTNLVGGTPADYGYRVISGRYRETVTGLNKVPVIASGTFRLNRVSEIGALNQ